MNGRLDCIFIRAITHPSLDEGARWRRLFKRRDQPNKARRSWSLDCDSNENCANRDQNDPNGTQRRQLLAQEHRTEHGDENNAQLVDWRNASGLTQL